MDVEAFIHSMVALAVSIIATLMLISLCRHFYCNNNKEQQYYQAIQTSSVICLIGYTIRLFTLFMLHIPFYCPKCGISHETAVTWQIISALFLFLSKPLTQIHFVLRLYYTFNNSTFASNKSTFTILATIIITEIICILLYFISGLIQLSVDENSPLLVEDDFDDGNYGKPFESKFTIVLLILAVISDLIVSYMLTHLFVHKLFKLLVMGIQSREIQPAMEMLNVTPKQTVNNEISNNDMNHLDINESLRRVSEWSVSSSAYSIMHVKKVQLQEEDTKMINTITRYTLLSSITMIFTQIYFMLQLIHILLIGFGGWKNNISYHHLDAPLAALSIIDSLLAICSIYLNFVFSRKWYKIFCNVCHKGLHNVCEKLTHKTVLKKQNKDEDGYVLME